MNRGFFGFRTFFYLVYAIVLTAGLLYLRFPAEKFKLFCEQRVEDYLSGSTCSIDRIAYHLPFSLIVDNVQISREVDGKRSIFRVGHCAVAPDFSSFFQTFDLSGEIYKGDFVLKLSVDVSEKSFQLSDLSVTGFDMDEWVNDFNLLDRKMSGIVEYSGDYQAKFESPLDGTGKGKLVAVSGNLELLQPVLSLSNLAYERITVEMTHEKKVVKFIGGEVSGKEINADFTGEMQTTAPFLNSSILLSGQLSPTESFLAAHPEEKKVVEQLLRRYRKSDLPYKVGGSVGRPTFRFSL